MTAAPHGDSGSLIKGIRRAGSFLIKDCGSERRQGEQNPKQIEMDGKAYFRFMDVIYLPRRPRDLTAAQVEELCELRLDLYDSAVDESLNRAIAQCMRDEIHQRASRESWVSPHCLDIGCGDGRSYEWIWSGLSTASIVGLDSSTRAARAAAGRGFRSLIIGDGVRVPIRSRRIDCVCALFVLHFGACWSWIPEVYRVLRCEGAFVFNFYGDDPSNLLSEVRRVGFRDVARLACSPVGGDHAVYCATR